MKITLLAIGKTSDREVSKIFDKYSLRINKFCKFDLESIPNIKQKLSEKELKIKEGKLILNKIKKGSFVVLLDDKGAEFTSLKFADFIEKKQITSTKNICFVIGGAYGFSDEVYGFANSKLSLSKMTFSHQIIRAIFAEQLYRAFSIINNQPYHHE